MEFYGLSFSLIELIAFGLLFLAFIYQLYFYLRYLNGVLRLRGRIRKDKVAFQTEQPPISVIICAKDESDNLRKFNNDVGILPLVCNIFTEHDID